MKLKAGDPITQDRKRKFCIYSFNPKTKQVTGISTLTTKPISEERLYELIKEEMSKPYYKHSIYEVIR